MSNLPAYPIVTVDKWDPRGDLATTNGGGYRFR